MALLIRRSISYTLMPHVPETQAVFCKILCNGSSLVAGCVYRSPSCGAECLVAIHDFLQQHVRRSAVMLMGDFNLPDINWTNMRHTSPSSEALIDLMLNFNLRQVVSCPTRCQGTATSILDLVLICNHLNPDDAHVEVVEGISDHRVPICSITLDYGLRFESTATPVADFSKADDASVLTFWLVNFTSSIWPIIPPPL